MPLTFQGGQTVPTAGTAAYTAAQQGTGAGNFDAKTNTLSVAPVPSTANQTNPSASTVSAPPKTTPVVTSKTAQDDYNEKLANFNKLITDLEAHTTAKNQAQAEAQAKQAQDDLNKSKLNLEQQGIDVKKSEADTKAKALTMASDNSSTSNTPQGWDAQTYNNFKAANPNTEPTAEDTAKMQAAGTPQGKINDANDANATAQQSIIDQKTQLFNDFQSKVSQIMNGTFPLSAPEQALISSVQASLERQKASVTGVETEAAARSGQEYTPAQAAGMIANKVMDLDNMAAGTIAQLKIAFGKQDYEMINSTYDKQTKLLDDKSLAIQKLHDTVVANEKDIREQAQKVQDNIDGITKDAAKNGASPEILSKISGSKTLNEAIANAGDMLQSATGTLGDYLQYKREAISKGLTPKDYTTFKNDQLRTEETIKAQAKLAVDNANTHTDKVQQKLEQEARGVLAKEFSNRSGTYGLNDAKVSQANKLAALFDQSYDPKTGNFNVSKAQYGELALGLANLISGSTGPAEATVNDLKTKTANGDWNGIYTYVTGAPANGSSQDIINQLAQSVVREARQAEADRGVDEQKLVGMLPTDLEDSRKQALIKNASIPFKGIEGVSKLNVNDYIKSNPADAETIAKMYEVPGAKDSDIEAYLRANGKIQ